VKKNVHLKNVASAKTALVGGSYLAPGNIEKAAMLRAEGSYVPTLKNVGFKQGRPISRALLLSETLRERVTLEYSLTLRYRYR